MSLFSKIKNLFKSDAKLPKAADKALKDMRKRLVDSVDKEIRITEESILKILDKEVK